MKNQIIICSLLQVLLLASCNTNSSESDTDTFYKDLSEQYQQRYFSPIDFAGQFNPENHLSKWDISDETLISGENEDQLQLGLKDLSLYSGSENKCSKFLIRLYRNNGRETSISSLSKGKIIGSKAVFNVKQENVQISITPYKGFLKWDILPTDKKKVDSIIFEIIAPGPYYGGGERYIATKLNGRTVSNQPNDHYWDAPVTELTPWANKHEPGHYKPYEPSYMQLAFYLNPFGEAWIVDDAASVFTTFCDKGERFKIRVENHQTTIYSIHRQTAKDAITTFTSIAGRQPEIPDWAAGVWVNLLDGQDSVLERAKRLKEWEIPATAIWVFDMYDIESSQGWQHWTDGIYHNLRALCDSLHSNGFRVLTYLHPYQEVRMPKSNLDNPMFTKLDSLGLLLVTPDSLQTSRYGHNKDGVYNFYEPTMGEIWAEMINMILIRDDFDGYMEDFGDISYCYDNEEKKWIAIDYGQESPLTPEEFNNLYPLVYHKLSYLLANELNEDIATFCRSGSLGSAAYTKIFWAGDQIATWDKTFGYPSAITSGISCGLSGYASWTPDILSNSPDKELWKRWVQFAAFTPIMRDHLWVNNPESVDIWYDTETPKYFKRYADMHMSLVPYIQKCLEEYRLTGVPVIRHMMLDFPDEPETFNCEYQYMFGPEYLVAPVVDKGHTIKEVYFPKGNWKNFWSDDIIESRGEWIKVPAPQDEIPVFERI